LEKNPLTWYIKKHIPQNMTVKMSETIQIKTLQCFPFAVAAASQESAQLAAKSLKQNN